MCWLSVLVLDVGYDTICSVSPPSCIGTAAGQEGFGIYRPKRGRSNDGLPADVAVEYARIYRTHAITATIARAFIC